ncbi:TIGR01440 family protein [Bacillus sp. 165]|uniref:TIGR01440 family protein n=1 Tax=Bacillus sp. 165 TaxID=1529117 RepID=UPI001ADB9933|nr:TIGR01440 family protein [Bacillus sp. 165]MBO9130074.1 TIGR01440 family protein [Bacillus sp. 165]
MVDELDQIKKQLRTLLSDFQQQASLDEGAVFVTGCSTSEVIGEKIGTSGTMEVAEAIYNALKEYAATHQIQLAFQCCEHLNRALVVERETAIKHNLEIVSVTPVRSAGGALATYAYYNMKDPVVVEFIKADGGIDIGDTFIGMHLKHVAVPLRSTVKQVGYAHVTMAKTRPKLIGGARAVYSIKEETYTCG